MSMFGNTTAIKILSITMFYQIFLCKKSDFFGKIYDKFIDLRGYFDVYINIFDDPKDTKFDKKNCIVPVCIYIKNQFKFYN